MHTDTTYFIPDKDYFVRVMEATFVRCNLRKTMKNVLGHTHVMLLGLGLLFVLGMWWLVMGPGARFSKVPVT